MQYALLLVQAEFRRIYFTLKSYFVQLIADQVLFILIFLFVTGAFTVVTDGNYGHSEQLASLAGFLIWRVGAGIAENSSRSIATDARWGTLEQVYLGRSSIGTILVARAIVYLVYYTIRVLIMAAIILFLLQIPIPFARGGLLVYLLTFVSMFGLTLILVGFQLVYKNIDAMAYTLSTIMLFLTGALSSMKGVPILFEVSRFLPLSIGIDLYRDMLVDGVGLTAVVNSPQFLWLLLNSAFYLAIGIIVLHWAHNRVLQDGSLAHY